MEILKLKFLAHSGIGRTAKHYEVISEFSKSEQQGLSYCSKMGWSVQISDTTLEVTEPKQYGFKMVALIKKK